MRSLQHTIRHLDNARYVGGPRTKSITGIVMHCTGGDTVEGAMSWLNRTLGAGEGPASYHYLLPKSGDIIVRMCDPEIVAYHAGFSHYPPVPTTLWRKWGSLNKETIGIAWANDNGSDTNATDDELTSWQIKAGLWLCVTLCRRYNIPVERVVGHGEVAPGRKTDPIPAIMPMSHWRKLITQELAK